MKPLVSKYSMNVTSSSHQTSSDEKKFTRNIISDDIHTKTGLLVLWKNVTSYTVSVDVKYILTGTEAGDSKTSSDVAKITSETISADVQDVLSGSKPGDLKTLSDVAETTRADDDILLAGTLVEKLTTESMVQMVKSETVIKEMHRGK